MSTDTSSVEHDPLHALQYQLKSDIGLRREENQDSYGVVETPAFRTYIVADGMGGVRGGAVASNVCVEVVKGELSKLSEITPEAIARAVEKSNKDIFEQGAKDPALTGMGTTFVALTFSGVDLIVTNVGDSRAYRIRNGELHQLTEDHTLVQELLKSGQITEDQASNHPVSHMLTRSLGPSDSVVVDSWKSKEPPQAGDIYLLCSDGLYNLVHPEELVEKVESVPFEEVAEELVSLANMRGGIDNITLILVKIGGESGSSASSLENELADEAARIAVTEKIELNGESYRNGESARIHPEDTVLKANIDFNRLKSTGQNESEASEQYDTDEPQRTERRFLTARSTFLAVAIVVGFLIALMLSRGGSQEAIERVEIVKAPIAISSEAATNNLAQSSSLSAAATSSQASEQPKADLAKIDDKNPAPAPAAAAANSSSSSAPIDSVSTSEFERLLERRNLLEKEIAKLETRLAAFDQPLSGEMGALLSSSSERAVQIERKIVELEAKFEEASRELSTWYGRKKRFDVADPVNLASEVTGSSENVRIQKDNFERATWNYLKEAEALRYSPDDPIVQQKVKTLNENRSAEMAKLAEAVEAAIGEAIGSFDKRISTLTAERDQLTSELKQLKGEISFARAVMGNDPLIKKAQRTDMERELAASKLELESLSKIMTGSPKP